MIARDSRPEMQKIWSEEGKLSRRLEVGLAAVGGWAASTCSHDPHRAWQTLSFASDRGPEEA